MVVVAAAVNAKNVVSLVVVNDVFIAVKAVLPLVIRLLLLLLLAFVIVIITSVSATLCCGCVLLLRT